VLIGNIGKESEFLNTNAAAKSRGHTRGIDQLFRITSWVNAMMDANDPQQHFVK
jgi:hypothetical protein